MAYDIPDKIKYREKIILNFDIRQLGYLIAFLLLGGMAYTLPLMQEARIVIAFLFLMAGAGFAFFDLETKLLIRWNYLTSIRSGGALDRRVRAFVGVKKIERDTVYLDNGGMRAIILVKPINMQLIDEGRQKSVILNYRDFLNQLSHPIQIIVRTVNVSLADYFSNHEAKIMKTKDESIISPYNDFRVHEEKFLKENFVKERLYYVVIPMDPRTSSLSGFLKRKKGHSQRQRDYFMRFANFGTKVPKS